MKLQIINVRVLELVNIERAKVGARPLRITDDLQRAADIRAKELTILFSHDRPDGSKCLLYSEESVMVVWAKI